MLILPESLREEVRKPFGKLYKEKNASEKAAKAKRPLITVGDQCAYELILSGVVPDILVFDFKVKRKEIPREMKEAFAAHAQSAYVVLSPPGAITGELANAISEVLSEGKGAVFVVGEDDLSSLLVMAHAKKGTLIYGQPDKGAVFVPLGGEKIRKKAQAFLDSMKEE